MATCSVPNCESDAKVKGFCLPHYKSFHRIGKPVADRETIHGTLERKFALKSTERNAAGCWIWKGRKDPDGYGSLRDGEKMKRAHRVSWELHHGPIPEGGKVLHKCNNPACVNPDHLKIGDHTENMADRKVNGKPWHSDSQRELMRKKMTGRKITWKAKLAEANRKLTKEQADAIVSRLQSGEKVSAIAAEYGMHRTSISKLKSGKYFVMI